MALLAAEVEGRVARLTLTRPERRNAMSLAMIEELAAALADLASHPDVRVAVLAGEGPDFCAGADFADIEAVRTSPDLAGYGRSFEACLAAIEDHPVPVIARVHGAALGAGCQLAVACDLAVAAEDARLGIPAARLGILINFESVQRLVLAAGSKRAGEMLLTGRMLSGVEAESWGVVNEAVPPGELDERTDSLAEAVAGAAPLSVRGAKRGIGIVRRSASVDRGMEGGPAAGYDALVAEAFGSHDLGEGLAAFRERRRPEFGGR